jgi:ATP-dependent DNA helicase DinG
MLARVFLDTPHSAHKSWIFTSATLGHDAGLEWFVQSCGLEGATILQVESPFNHAVQSALYVPNDFPLPNDASHSACVAALVAGAAEVLRGKTLVLTTTLKAMRAIAQGLKSHFCDTNDVAVLLQGELPKNELIARFRARKGAGDTGFILVASATFWEGIDVPGESLQLVVIDKLPFTPPNDPLMKARGDALEASGKSAFQHLHLPRAAIALKQGAGRLIRRETDRGILVVCDVRLKTRGYGRKIIAALPAMRVIGNEGEFNEALEALTRPSTTDPY